MGWFEKSPEKKAEDCNSCLKVYLSGNFEVCDRCGHLFNGKKCSCI